jgi:hydrogenase maturation protease
VGVSAGILGVGNLLTGDDGVGVHVIRELIKRYRFPDSVRLIDGGTMGLDLLPFIEDIDRLIIIDAVDFKKPPGAIEIINGDSLPAILSSKLSVHQIGLSDLFFVIRMKELPLKEICLIGIQPKSMETGTELSEEIKAKVDILIKHVLNKLRDWRVEV